MEHNCTACDASTSIQHPLIDSNCVVDCGTENYWYLDDNLIYQCLSGLKCPESRPILETHNKQCIESCKKLGTCVYCQTNVVYDYRNECVSQCPTGTIYNLAERIKNENIFAYYAMCCNADICFPTCVGC